MSVRPISYIENLINRISKVASITCYSTTIIHKSLPIIPIISVTIERTQNIIYKWLICRCIGRSAYSRCTVSRICCPIKWTFTLNLYKRSSANFAIALIWNWSSVFLRYIKKKLAKFSLIWRVTLIRTLNTIVWEFHIIYTAASCCIVIWWISKSILTISTINLVVSQCRICWVWAVPTKYSWVWLTI